MRGVCPFSPSIKELKHRHKYSKKGYLCRWIEGWYELHVYEVKVVVTEQEIRDNQEILFLSSCSRTS